MVAKKSSENTKISKEPTEKSEKKEKVSQEEYEKKVIELAEKGMSCEKIGYALKKQGIHPKDYNKKISKILGKKYVSPDLKNTKEKLERIKIHYQKNPQDKRSMREKDRVFSQIRKIEKYLKISR
jgi:ribosomal protein S15P/S13E